MTYNEVLDKVCVIVADKMGETVNANTMLSDLNADSLDRVEIAMELGNSFSVNISDADLDFIEYQPDLSMFDLAKFVCNKKGIAIPQKTVAPVKLEPVITKQNTINQNIDKIFTDIDRTLAQIQQDHTNRARILIKQYPYTR